MQLGVGHSRRGRQVLAGAGNLGQLQGLAATTADEAAWTAQWVAPQAMANRCEGALHAKHGPCMQLLHAACSAARMPVR